MIERMKIRCLGIAVFYFLSTMAIATDYYKLPGTKRIDKDLYSSGKMLIETRYCYHFTYGEDAVLKYEGAGEHSGSKIIWADDSNCEVKKVITR